MSKRHMNALFPSLLLMLATAACQDVPVAPGALLAPAGTPSFAQFGNSAAAHGCQQGGYQSLFRADGTGFKNAGECVSYAAHGGIFKNGTATFTHVMFGACNALTWGYELDGVQHDVESFAGGCGGQAGSDLTVTFVPTQTLRVYLRDNTCGDTYFEDGNHAVVTGSNPYDIKIADSGGFCERGPDVDARGDIIESGSGNLNVTKTIS